MDTKKIREALAHAKEIGEICGMPYTTRLFEEALAELDAAPKVLTDEEIESAARDHDASFAHQRSFREGARYARDNGYFAPAAGLTVEEVERANNVKDQCIATAWDGLSGKILVDDGSGTMRELLCDAHDVIRYLLNKR